MKVKSEREVAQSRPILCDPMGCKVFVYGDAPAFNSSLVKGLLLGYSEHVCDL